MKKHIVSIPRHTWNREGRLPWDSVEGEGPEGGEPENYIKGRAHSEQAASEMEDIFEFNAPVVGCEIMKRERLRPFGEKWHLTRPEEDHRGLFRPPGDGHVLLVNETGREWFEQQADEWVGFDEVVLV